MLHVRQSVYPTVIVTGLVSADHYVLYYVVSG